MPVIPADITLPDEYVLTDTDRDALKTAQTIDARLAALEASLSTIDAKQVAHEAKLSDVDQIRAKFDTSGKLAQSAIPAIPAGAVVDGSGKVMMTADERAQILRFRAQDLSSATAVGVGKTSMFPRYTGTGNATWTLDPAAYVVAVENGSADPAAVLTLLAPAGQSFEQSPVQVPSRSAANVAPGGHVICCKRSHNSTVWRVL